jgi:molybdopterin/thiamine biosynthesis adenylyltransferase
MDANELTPEERAIYEWQMWVPGFGEEGQRKLKDASVLVSRIGGLGGLVAYQLAAAGVGHLILAHAGNIKPSDLNRQLLMTHDALGKSRLESAKERLLELNPRLEITTIPENPSPSNVAKLVESVDIVVCCVPMFEERLALNVECVRQRKPLIDCAMYELTGQLTTIIPGQTACVACRVSTPPTSWKREFPVFGAVSGTVGCMGAMEAIKVLTGLGEPLLDRVLMFDLRDMRFRTIKTQRNSNCQICSSLGGQVENVSSEST